MASRIGSPGMIFIDEPSMHAGHSVLLDRRRLHFCKFSLIEYIPGVFKFVRVTEKMSRSYEII